MPIPRIDLTLRNIQRYQQILNIFLRYGFGHLLDRLNLSTYIDLGKRAITRKSYSTSRLPPYARIRLAFEELGPTFVKLGQIMSLRSLALPPDFVKEMEKLQDRVSPIPFDSIKKIIEDCFKTPLDEKFAEFDEIPLASASIAQTHRARLEDGSNVVVKVSRPGLKKLVETDISILQDLASLIEKQIPEMKLYDPSGIVNQLAYTITREINFLNEARNIEIFKNNFKDDHSLCIPAVYWDHTGSTVLTMDFIDGVKISHTEEMSDRGYNLKTVADRGASLILQQIFEHGFFHADPHPGNIFVLDGDVIAPIDFGITGRLDADMKSQLADLLLAVTRKDVDKVIRFFQTTGSLDDDFDSYLLKSDITDFLDRYTGVPLIRLDIQSLITDLFAGLHRHSIRIRTEYLLLTKTLVVYEDIGRGLDPEFDMVETARPYLKNLIWEKYSPGRIKKDVARAVIDYMDLFKQVPEQLMHILGKLRTGKLNVDFRHRGLEPLIIELEKSSNRIAFSLVVGSLIIASSFLWTTSSRPLVGGFPVLGIVGYLIASLLGIWLIIAILRSGRL